jgi:tetratricopeptide (TPR) repeat protein
MIRWIGLVIVLLTLTSVCLADEITVQFEQANQLYRDGEYQKAVVVYEKILTNGAENSVLYYNLGNAYFKLSNLPAAILQYERALRISPHDDDIQYNLRLANLRVIDKIDPLPRLFFVTWWTSFVNLLSSTGWTIVAVISLWCAAGAGVLMMIGRSALIQRIGFVVSILTIVVGIIAFTGTYQRYQIEQNNRAAIIFSQSVAVKSAPDEQSTDLFVLHEGVKVEFLDAVGEWRKIRVADGKIGWLPLMSVQVI